MTDDPMNMEAPDERSRPAGSWERIGDLVALIALVALAAAVLIAVGPDAGAVTTIGVGLFVTWRGAGRR
ncbi:putative RDD family membrane protein YckC [Streptacidiphilus sp. MAP12-33]|uniref:hypothetical protein n=1 Tax=Streptacidiphilus sp. MAP12-33 TaxID=3156266 RepID=UPI0035111C66